MKIEILEIRSAVIDTQLRNNVGSFNTNFIGESDSKPLLAITNDEQGALLGGVAGRTVFGHFLIEVVWVSETLRGQGVGTKLMNEAEAIARKRGCNGAQVDTLSFQGIEFYTSLGFKEVGRIKNFPEGHDKVYYFKEYK